MFTLSEIRSPFLNSIQPLTYHEELPPWINDFEWNQKQNKAKNEKIREVEGAFHSGCSKD